MYLLMVGINFRNASAGVHEKMTGEGLNLPEFLEKLKRINELAGKIVLPTPSGVEIYTATRNLPEAEKNITKFISEQYDLYGPLLNECVYVYTLNDCIRHLFGVIAGLGGIFADAEQALEQARESYRVACENEAANHVLCTLFEKVTESVENIVNEAGKGNKAKIEADVEREMTGFYSWLNSRSVLPTIGALNKKGQEIRERELEKALNRLDTWNGEEKEIVVSLANAVVAELLQDPVNKVKDISVTGQGHLYSEILRNLFRLEVGHDEVCELE